MDCDVKADDKFCVNLMYRNEEDEKFYVKKKKFYRFRFLVFEIC